MSRPVFPGVWYLTVAAVLAMVAGRSIRHRASGVTITGIVALVICATTLGILSLPRTSVLGRTMSFADGTGEAVEFGEHRVVALSGGATYISPTFSIQPGSIVQRIDIDPGARSADLAIRTVDSDGSGRPWSQTVDGIRSRVVGGSSGARRPAGRGRPIARARDPIPAPVRSRTTPPPGVRLSTDRGLMTSADTIPAMPT